MACDMPEVEDLDDLSVLLQLIVDPDRSVQDFSYAGSLCNRRPHVREAPEQIDVIQKGVSESLRSSRVVGADVVQEDLEIG